MLNIINNLIEAILKYILPWFESRLKRAYFRLKMGIFHVIVISELLYDKQSNFFRILIFLMDIFIWQNYNKINEGQVGRVWWEHFKCFSLIQNALIFYTSIIRNIDFIRDLGITQRKRGCIYRKCIYCMQYTWKPILELPQMQCDFTMAISVLTFLFYLK